MLLQQSLKSYGLQIKTALFLVFVTSLGIGIGGQYGFRLHADDSSSDSVLGRRLIRATADRQATFPEINLTSENFESLSPHRLNFQRIQFFNNLLRKKKHRRKLSCPDSSSLELRKAISDFVLTGSVQWISEGVNKIQNIQGEGVTGGVLVTSVLKGPKYLEGRMLVIAGFGKDEFCISRSRVNDERIFFVRLDENRKVKLSSSLMKVNAKNLRMLTISTAGKIYF